ncbi:MAG: response regulator, partial [Clostridia bacterium]|nr:response regulator [Clostridia bacterium]
FLDIEMGSVSGLDVCRELLKINPHTNVVYLTAYREYSFDAWDTGACGFMLKPIKPEDVKKQLKKLRYHFFVGGEEQ